MNDNNEENHITDSAPPEEKKKLGPLQIISSVLAAMIGIQSEKNRERDFNSGRMGHFIIVGIIFVVIFVFSLISIVNNILEETGM